eukprot:TRINITY_DN11319_c0_g1_i1.p1 TRINITY_DN11319_c0_g1~~TRINITY_DN11319_c0_g1_i1.p1  ORF type:complete len:334 (-),score=30.12 TRINITY_DN11319_c0_g1_i1:67-1068(-)
MQSCSCLSVNMVSHNYVLALTFALCVCCGLSALIEGPTGLVGSFEVATEDSHPITKVTYDAALMRLKELEDERCLSQPMMRGGATIRCFPPFYDNGEGLCRVNCPGEVVPSNSTISCTKADGWSGVPTCPIYDSCLEAVTAGGTHGHYQVFLRGVVKNVYCGSTGSYYLGGIRQGATANADYDPRLPLLANGATEVSNNPSSYSGFHPLTDFPSNMKLGADCKVASGDSFSIFLSEMDFYPFTPGTKGTYASSDWGMLSFDNLYRHTYFVCGSIENDTYKYTGIGLCSGAGGTGSWASHQASFSVDGANLQVHVGCNGNSEAGSFVRFWLREI